MLRGSRVARRTLYPLGMWLESYALSIAGRRPNNEDAICANPDLGLFVVAGALVEAAYAAGSRDNISAVVVRVR